MIQLTTLTDSEILLKLQGLAQQYNIRLSFAHKMFYISLMHLCEEIGELDEDSKQYFIELSVSAFAQRFRVSHTTIVQSLKLLSECGAIRREKHKRAFCKIMQGEYVLNGAYRTYINTLFLQML